MKQHSQDASIVGQTIRDRHSPGLPSPKATPAPKDDRIVDILHGISVPDPFRPLENLNDPTTAAWVAAEGTRAHEFLAALPDRERIQSRLVELLSSPRLLPPEPRAGKLFTEKNSGLDNFDQLYVSDLAGGNQRLLIDPNLFSADGSVSVQSYSPSTDGEFVAYQIVQSGSDWSEIRIRRTVDGADLPDLVRYAKFSGVGWNKDCSGFYYSRYPEPPPGEEYSAQNLDHRIYFHRLDTPQSEDKFIWAHPNPQFCSNAELSDDGELLIITTNQGSDPDSGLYFQPAGGGPVVCLVPEGEAAHEFLGKEGHFIFVLTDRNAPCNRIVKIDLSQPEPEHWIEIIPESENMLISASLRGDKLVLNYFREVGETLFLAKSDGSDLREIELPGVGSISGLTGTGQDPNCFFQYSSFDTPPSTYRLDLPSGKVSLFAEPTMLVDRTIFETQHITYPSKDGTSIPMCVVHRKGLVLNGQNPTLILGYGGFGNIDAPDFRVSVCTWIEMGGVFAIPSLRGEGAFGRKWHEAGRQERKQNVFDDFIAAAEWLIAKNYTEPRKLGINGGSNGGLLVAACMIQRPDLFAAVIPEVGVLDMLRYHKFTIGHAWVEEYGSAENAKDFLNLLRYSPLHNISPGTTYPPVLVMTSDHDDRVHPAHSLKFAATLQEAQGGPAPILLRVESQSGHGGGTALAKAINEIADKLAFLKWALGPTPQTI